MKPLEGIKVVELADYVSAPVCARILADMGAEVIKIERDGGNTWRGEGPKCRPARFCETENPVFDIYNTGKKCIVLNLKTPEGLNICKKLLASADVFVTNNRVKALQRMGLDYDSIKSEFPKLIYAIGLGYGEKGPDADTPAFDHTAFWARTGFLLDCGCAGENYMPVLPPGAMGDTFTGMTLVSEILAALLNRAKTGKGDYVKSSLFHNGIFANGEMQIITQRPFGDTTYPKTRPSFGLPVGYYRCKDGGYLYIAAGYAPVLVPKVFTMIGRPDLIESEKFNSAEARIENRDELWDILQSAMLTKDVDEWVKLSRECDIPVTKMKHYADVSEDEQALTNNYIQAVHYSNGNVDMIASSPIEMDSLGELHTEPSHLVGEDTDEILLKYGYSENEIEQYKKMGVINN